MSKGKKDLSLLQNQFDIPLDGWQWEGMDDLQHTGVNQCEFCGQPIRYAHILSHPNVVGLHIAGCDCAEELVSYTYPHNFLQDKDKDFKSFCNRWDAFCKKTEWQTNNDGNMFARYKRHNIAIIKSKKYPVYAVTCNDKYVATYNGVPITDLATAQKAVFELVQGRSEWTKVDFENSSKL